MSSEKNFRTDHVIIIAASCFIMGWILGMVMTNMINKPRRGPAMATTAPPPISPPSSGAGNLNAAARELRSVLDKDPNNVAGWTKLGDMYFDSNQYMESIEAYTKSLELNPNNPNVITDRAIMYRKAKNFPMAADELRRAAQMDPNHLNSATNLGVVLRWDLNDAEGAIEAWEMALKRNPPPDQADQIRREIETLRAQMNK